MKLHRNVILSIIFIILMPMAVAQSASKQKALRVTIVHDSSDSVFFMQAVTEIEALLSHRYALEIVSVKPADALADIKTAVELAMSSNRVDIVVALSPASSSVLTGLKTFSKPAIAAAVLDRQLQGIYKTERHTSGIHNFTYIESPFDIKKDLETFKALTDFQHLGVLVHAEDVNLFPDLFGYLGKQLSNVNPKATYSLIEIDPKNPVASLNIADPLVDAIYLTPALAIVDEPLRRSFLAHLKEKKIPTFSLMGEADVLAGAMAAIAPGTNMTAVSRRIALDIMKIAEGTNAADLNVQIETYGDNFVLNMDTMTAVGIYPDWAAMGRARFIIPDMADDADAFSLAELIAQGLEKNLDLLSSRYNTRIQEKEVDSAKSNRLPQAAISSSVGALDRQRAAGNQGEPAPVTWSATGTLGQTVFSDDINANIKIQKLLSESSRFQEKVDTLNTVTDVMEGYVNLLLAQSNYRILNDNLNVTRKNLDISKMKQSVGYVGATDVYRWESELARDKISLNDAQRDVRLAEMAINRLINRQLEMPVQVETVKIDDPNQFFMADARIKKTIRNFRQMILLSNFLVEESNRYLPELKQINATIRSQKRQVLNLRRDYYLPEFQLNAQIDKTIDEWDTAFKTPEGLDHPWSVGLTASLPLWSGGRRRHELAKEKLRLAQYHLDEANLRSQLHLLVRTNVETLTTSFREMELSNHALEAARRNFIIVQEAYGQGSLDVTDLVDAQNALVQAEQGTVIAKYQFVLDFFNLERSVGEFHFLRTLEEKEAFYGRIEKALSDH